ncbi:MAG: formylglycine-generating enzyme family protein [Deltaproteobacteria bacterium]|jgi:formylglycine-generating enzyme required for sulfatase activity|nr:formylglycine-generating enzyme family protein [Deltaproteobacteria bacterium]
MRAFGQISPALFAALLFIATLFAAPLASAQDYENSLGMSFVKIKAGTFMMGNDPKQYDATEPDEEPRHKVTITRDYYIGVHEVTQAQWERIMGDNPSNNPGPNLPVENMTTDQVLEFIRRLNELENTETYRLPTEAEWEYAARAGTDTPWHFGSDPEKIDDYDWTASNSNGTKKVGTLRPNPWGLHDVHGNVKELVSDYYSLDYYEDSPQKDPAGPEEDELNSRVARGGAWYNSPERTRSSYRYFLDNGETDENIGFRLAFNDPPSGKSQGNGSRDDLRVGTPTKKDLGKLTSIAKKDPGDPDAAESGGNPAPKAAGGTEAANPSVETFTKLKDAFNAKSRFSILREDEE